jgi:hypothetical protein
VSISLDSHYLVDVSNGNYTVGSSSTDTLTLDRFNSLVSSFETKLIADGLVINGSFVSGGEWGAAYLIADLCYHNAILSENGAVKKESFGNDYSYELKDKTISENYYLTKYNDIVLSINQEEYDISINNLEVERDDSEIWFSSLDRNPIPSPVSRSELVRRGL